MPPLTQEQIEDLWIFDHADYYYPQHDEPI